MNHLCRNAGLVGLCLSIAGWPIASRGADRPAFVGVWASSANACRADPNQTQDIALRYSETMIDGNEWHCRVGNLRADAKGWTARLACSVEGTPFIRRVRWHVDPGGKLLETEKDFTETYVRCKDSDFRVGTGR